MTQTQTYPVAIIGGGPVGLTTSILLSLRNIPHVLFERHASTSIHPKACGINQRTTEIFRVLGIEEAVYAAAAPADVAGRTAWYTSFGERGREILARDSWGGGAFADEYARHSPSRYAILPQIRLEPILAARAKGLNPGGIRYASEVVDVVQEEKKEGADHVVLKVVKVGKKVGEGEEAEAVAEEVRARFVVAADGGRGVTEKLGVRWVGEKGVADMVTAHFRCPLSRHHPDPRNFITWFTHPAMGGSMKTGFLYPVGPWPKDYPDEREEWVFACSPTAGDPERFDEATMVSRLRSTLQIPDLQVEMISLSHWCINAIYAERYRVGRVFLVGDSAHRIPPLGALGMNTGVQDAQNLVWKLALALGDEKKYDALLDSYDTERKPIGKRVGLSSLQNFRQHALVMDAALGMSPEKTVDENEEALASYFDEQHPLHAEKREAMTAAQRKVNLEFKAPGNEVGWFYPSADINNEGGKTRHDGQLRDDGTLDFEFYHPSTIPGHNLPHCWLQREGRSVAIRDLIPLDKLLLVTETSEWKDFESDIVHVELVGEQGWADVNGDWRKQCGVSTNGAVLVRPDGIVAWRGEPESELFRQWPHVLDRAMYLRSEK